MGFAAADNEDAVSRRPVVVEALLPVDVVLCSWCGCQLMPSVNPAYLTAASVSFLETELSCRGFAWLDCDEYFGYGVSYLASLSESQPCQLSSQFNASQRPGVNTRSPQQGLSNDASKPICVEAMSKCHSRPHCLEGMGRLTRFAVYPQMARHRRTPLLPTAA